MDTKNNKQSIKSFLDLRVYQSSYRASITISQEILPNLPPEENYDLKDQLRRSSKTIPRLIAEGFSKKHQPRSFQKYIDDALGESNETIVSLSHVRDLYGKKIKNNLCDELIATYDGISRQLYKLGEVWQDFSKRKILPPIPRNTHQPL
jgi:four helix bundle protein